MDRIRELQSRVEAGKTLQQHEMEQHKLEINKLKAELDKVRQENLKYQNRSGEKKQYFQAGNAGLEESRRSQTVEADTQEFNIILLGLNAGIIVTFFLKWINVSIDELSLIKIFMYVGKLIDTVWADGAAPPWKFLAVLFLLVVMAGAFIYHVAAVGQQIIYNKCTFYKSANGLNLVCTLVFIMIVLYAASQVNDLLFNLTSMGVTAVPIVNALLSAISLVIIHKQKNA